jgi:imidazolonepropionase-like amidohydrolase
MDLLGDAPADMIARPVVALHVNLNEGGVRSTGGAMSLALTRLRELFDDARLYARQRAAFDRRALREMRVSRLDLERIAEALAGRIPIVVTVSRAADILRTLELAREQRFRLVLESVEEGHRVAVEIAAANVPVIVRPHQNLPSTFARLGTRFDNAALLARAGVRVVIAPQGAHEARTLRQEVGNAIAWGLDRDVALRAVTSEPARVFGLERDYGRVERGRVANLVVWNGDPFELSSWPTDVIVRGVRTSLATRQTELFERYRELDRVPRGFPRATRP